MLNVEVVRGLSTPHGTPGKWTILETGWTCDTLELPWADNERGRSCTIADTYLAKLELSEHLGGPRHQVYRIEDKHGRENVMVHNANFAGEVKIGDETQLHGCTAVGRGYGQIERNDGKKNDDGTPATQFGILRSVKTLEELIEATQGDDLVITYKWAPGCAPEAE